MQKSKYEMEINRISSMERLILAIVLITLFLIFALVSQEKTEQDTASSRSEQTKGKEQ